jgi:ElaB/YqjD/DUF883 family membrane-anchored ribosome-binding protein
LSNQVAIHQDVVNGQEDMKEELMNVKAVVSGTAQILSKAIDSIGDKVDNIEMKIDELGANMAGEFNEIKMGIGYLVEEGVEALNKSKEQILGALKKSEEKLEGVASEIKQEIMNCTEQLVERNDNLIEEIKEETENARKKIETIVTDNYTEQMKMNESIKETIKENNALMKQEAEDIKKVINKLIEKLLNKVNDVKENVKENGNKLAGLDKDFKQIVMRSTLRENAMLGRLDNFKDELYETRKILGVQIDYLQRLEGKIKDVRNQAGICLVYVVLI